MQDIKMIQTNTERRRKAKTGCELFLKLSPRRKISPPLTLAGQNDLTIKTKIGFLILLFRQTHNISFCLFVFLSLRCCLDLILHGNSQYIFLSLCLSVCILSLRCCLDLILHGNSQYIFLCLCLSVKVGGLDSRDQSRSRSRTSYMSRRTFLNCRDFLDGPDQLFFFLGRDF